MSAGKAEAGCPKGLQLRHVGDLGDVLRLRSMSKVPHRWISLEVGVTHNGPRVTGRIPFTVNGTLHIRQIGAKKRRKFDERKVHRHEEQRKVIT